MFIEYEHIIHSEIRKHIKGLNKSGLLAKRIMLVPKMTKNHLAKAFILAIQQIYDEDKLDLVPDEIYDYYLAIAKPDNKRATDTLPEQPEVSQEPPKGSKRGKSAPSPTKKASRGSEKAEVAVPKKKRGRPPKKKLTAKVTKPAKTTKVPKKTKVAKKAKVAKRTRKSPGNGTSKQTSSVYLPAKKTKRHEATLRSADKTGPTRAKVYADIVTDKKPRTKREIVAEMNEYYGGSEQEAIYWVGGYNGLMIALGKMVKRSDGKFVYSG